MKITFDISRLRPALRRAASRFTIIDLIMAAPALTALVYRITLTL